jgi:hypothetical protein
MDGQGTTYHVGSRDTYLALYSPISGSSEAGDSSYTTRNGLNHIGLVVPDIDALESRIKKAGYQLGPQWDYEPGRRFYFHNRDNIEIEIVSYA